jgi:hypothetical protein
MHFYGNQDSELNDVMHFNDEVVFHGLSCAMLGMGSLFRSQQSVLILASVSPLGKQR